MLSDDVDITVNIEAIKKAPAPPAAPAPAPSAPSR
jgi:hypothetical protein